MLSEGIGKAHFWLMLIAFNLTFFPQHYLGMHGMPRRTFTYQEGLGFEAMNLLSTIGSLVLGFSILIFLWNVFHSLRKGESAGLDPWAGRPWSGRSIHRRRITTSGSNPLCTVEIPCGQRVVSTWTSTILRRRSRTCPARRCGRVSWHSASWSWRSALSRRLCR